MTVNIASDTPPPPPGAPPKAKAAWVGPLVEYGPLALFLGAYFLWGLIPATKVLIAATAVALALSWLKTRTIPKMPLITAGLVGLFGGLTIWLDDEIFIKLKPTIVQVIFAALLLGGLALGKQPLRYVMGHALALDERGWSALTLRFGLFFIVAAIANEIVWRTQSTDTWVLFKFPGLVVVTMLFFLAQIPLIQRHSTEPVPEAPAGAGERSKAEGDDA